MVSVRADTPAIYVQCDWDESISEDNGEAWVSCKFRDEPSFDGKIQRKGNRSVTISEGFSIQDLSESAIYVKHNESGHGCTFEAPCATFRGLHHKSIISLDVSPGGLGVSVSTDDQLRMWESQTGRMRMASSPHEATVYFCRFFPSGIVVVSGGSDMQLKIWSAETGRCPVTLIGHKGSITDLAFVERGRNIISTSKDGTVKLWDCGAACCLDNLLEVESTINCCSLGTANNFMELGEPEEASSDREVGTEGKLLLVGCEDGSVHCVAVRSRRLLFTINLGSAVNSVVFLSSEKFAVGTQSGQVLCYDLQAPTQPCNSWFESNSSILRLAPLDQSGLFISRADGTCTYYSFTEGALKRVAQFTGPDIDPVYDITYDGRYLFTACRDAKIRKYDVARMLKNLSKVSY